MNSKNKKPRSEKQRLWNKYSGSYRSVIGALAILEHLRRWYEVAEFYQLPQAIKRTYELERSKLNETNKTRN